MKDTQINMHLLSRFILLTFFIAALPGCNMGQGKSQEEDSLPAPASDSEGGEVNSRSTGGALSSKTYYVRPDGGSFEQCTGLADAPYPGNGTGLECAWDHPFRAFPPGADPRIAGGDTLLIGSGSYQMGYGAPGSEDCDPDGAYDCHMAPVPSSPDPSQPTRILGVGWESGCTNPPELWGSQRPWYVLNLSGSSNVEVVCLEISDHADCVEDHANGFGGSELTCERESYPYGDWAPIGIYAEDSSNVLLRDLDIHGLANTGIHAARLSDWRVENVRIASNGWAGWDGDIEGDDSNSGTLNFRNWTVEWNGCSETYPGKEPHGCWSQTAGGYGDGVGTGETGGHWIIEDSAFLHNTSDGLDLLYTRVPGSMIEIRRSIAQGNAGDQFKTSGPTLIENVIAISNCGFFEGNAFTYNVDYCRAGGSAIALTFMEGDQLRVINSTIAGEGDCLVIAECGEGENCSGDELVDLRNNIFLGNSEFGGSGDQTCLAWYGSEHDPFRIGYSLINTVKGMPDSCPNGSLCDVTPGIVNNNLQEFDAQLLADSPAIDAGDNAVCPTSDYHGDPRPVDGDGDGNAICDMGAYEFSDAADQAQALAGGVVSTPPGAGVDQADWLTYQNERCKFLINYPPTGSLIEEGDQYARIDLPVAPGTNLREKYLELSCREVPGSCDSPHASGYSPSALGMETRIVDGAEFSVQSAIEGAAGNIYEWESYSTQRGDLCLSLTLVLHSVNAENYSPPIPEFGRTAERAALESILSSLAWLDPR